MMVARSLGSIAADALTVPERVLLFCVGSGTDWQTAGITGATVTMLAVKGPVDRRRRRQPVYTSSADDTAFPISFDARRRG
jgi:hypothetical protein